EGGGVVHWRCGHAADLAPWPRRGGVHRCAGGWVAFEAVMRVRQRLWATGPAAPDPSSFVLVIALTAAIIAAAVHRASARWVLPDEPLHRLRDRVAVPPGPRVLLDRADRDPPQAGRLGIRPGARQLVQPAAGQRPGDRGAGAGHGILPERHELRGAVLDGRVPLPAGIGIPVHRVPRRPGPPPRRPLGGVLVFGEGHVLQQPAQGYRRRAERRAQPGRVQPAALPREDRTLALQGTQEGGGLIARGRRPRKALPAQVVIVGHGRRTYQRP